MVSGSLGILDGVPLAAKHKLLAGNDKT